MRRKGVILAIFIAFSIGLMTGITTVILKGKKEPKEPKNPQTASSPLAREPISIELMEKIEELKQTLRENPKDVAAWVKLGNIYSEHNQYREAIEAYSQSLSIKPNDPDIRTNLGLMLRSWGDNDGAIEEFKRAARYDPKHINSRYYLGLTWLQNKGKTQEAIQAWEDYLKVEPKGQRANQVRVEIERLKTLAAEGKRK